MKVTYRERTFLDKYKCIDREVTRHFDTSWNSGGLTYFKHGQFTVFVVETDFIVSIAD